jgi:hypothetical protein
LENLRNEILVEFWNSKDVNNAIAKMHPVELQQDLKSEVFLILAELDNDKIVGLYQRKELKFYIVRIILNLVKSTDKKFFQKYRNFIEYKEIDTAEVFQEDIIDNVINAVDELYWYQKEVLRLYANEFDCNARELSRKTGIPYMSLIRTINQTKKELKKKIRK